MSTQTAFKSKALNIKVRLSSFMPFVQGPSIVIMTLTHLRFKTGHENVTGRTQDTA